ncbi:coatomer subunit epsilon-1-like [Brachypodium distachyon]|uniref:Coatomer subunit epsilon n=1 Tax=Brachypodium distachyon TaxID=15368 RepID=I1HKS3_BRADI|nr:coatomer subunit epsilon-1-like [Brachypodium distachyon]KQK06959.1 hypothetical protein BRADI_2g31740v3 [Brachypodium distachyon]|eukprot:XP_024314835.1 coatomer subunit epsilon-1-like [Brachypodium distachyon]
MALGSYQLVISEIDSSAATSLQTVKLLVLYLSGDKEGAISSLKEWLSDSAIGSNSVLRLIAGIYLCMSKITMRLSSTHTLEELWTYCHFEFLGCQELEIQSW